MSRKGTAALDLKANSVEIEKAFFTKCANDFGYALERTTGQTALWAGLADAVRQVVIVHA